MDEYYRIYICRDNQDWGIEVEAPEDLIQRFKAADKAFREAEDELYVFYKAAKEQTKPWGT